VLRGVFAKSLRDFAMYTKHNIDEPSNFGKGIVSLFTLRKLPETFNFASALQCYKDNQVDALFEEPASMPAPNKKFKVETVAEHSKSVEQEINQALNRSSSNGLKRSHQEAEDVVQAWFETWVDHGKAGNVGLVPAPARNDFPTNEKMFVDEELEAYLVHFYEFVQARKSLH